MHERGRWAHLELVHGVAAELVVPEFYLKYLPLQALTSWPGARGAAWTTSPRWRAFEGSAGGVVTSGGVAVRETSRKRSNVDASWHRRLGASDLSSAHLLPLVSSACPSPRRPSCVLIRYLLPLPSLACCPSTLNTPSDHSHVLSPPLPTPAREEGQEQRDGIVGWGGGGHGDGRRVMFADVVEEQQLYECYLTNVYRSVVVTPSQHFCHGRYVWLPLSHLLMPASNISIYTNCSLHLGHAFTISRIEFKAGFQRMSGKCVLLPHGFYVTGMLVKVSLTLCPPRPLCLLLPAGRRWSECTRIPQTPSAYLLLATHFPLLSI